MALVPEEKRPQLVCDLTERIVEEYYTERGFELPEYSYVLHDRLTDTKEDSDEPMQHLHTHVVLPGTISSIAERLPVYNNKERGHDVLFREIATQHFSNILDDEIGTEWRLKREKDLDILPDTNDLDKWFPR